ncbi:MAG: DNA mismatch repair endonuclease MutL [Anaerolineaceae bacterium]
MTIKVLKEEVASQIAAGEVVERPASVVKELTENAIDAHASSIRMRIEDAGKKNIEIMDDGDGIPFNELELAITRHATSKLDQASDLFAIKTLGFRGEALASIASVSRFLCVSKTDKENVGGKIAIEGGRIISINPTGGVKGTLIRVEDLFFNVPARLKFLKRTITEKQQIDAFVSRYALAYPEIRFELTHDHKPVLQTSGNGNRREIFAQIYGVDVAKQMLEVNLSEDDLKLEGLISPVSLTRSNRREITFFVNGRWVQDVTLSAALMRAYHTLLMVGRFPLAMLFINIPPEEVDVNVHPTKAQVRFRSPDRVFSAVQRGTRRALLAYSPVPQLSNRGWGYTHSSEHSENNWSWNQGNTPNEELSIGSPAQKDEFERSVLSQPNLSDFSGLVSEIPLLRLVGQVGNAYLIAEGPDGLYLIDQHAAHERILFEKMMAGKESTLPSQTLLDPAMLHLPPQSAQLLEENIPVLAKLGFQIETFGPDTFRIRAIPSLLAGSDPLAGVRVVVEDFEEDETPLQDEIEAKVAARVCKRAAVKAGQVLTMEEQNALLRNLEKCKSPRTCPHGRPTMIHLSVDLLERQFGRKGSR